MARWDLQSSYGVNLGIDVWLATLVTEMIVILILPEFVTCNVNLQRVIITQINSSENYLRVIDYTLALCTWMRTCLVTWTVLEPQRRS